MKFSWPYAANASRYRVRWSPAPYGKWPGPATYVDSTPGGWIPQTSRSSTRIAPTDATRDQTQTAAAYANPLFGQVEANNAYRRDVSSTGASLLSKWVLAFPTPPTPDPGDALTLGTYNVELAPRSGARVNALAKNIADHSLDVVALQEASSATADDIVTALPSGWKRASPEATNQQQIIYSSAKFRLVSYGTFPLLNPGSGTSIEIPWARLTSTAPNARSFFVVSVHFTVTAGKTQADQNKETGRSATAVMGKINALNKSQESVIIAGDFTSNREPYGDANPAQPTFVRAGYYDSMAAVSKVGYTYSTHNGDKTGKPARQVPTVSGLGTRADYIVFKGFRGSKQYVNVANWSSGGLIPSDHNLVYAALQIPRMP